MLHKRLLFILAALAACTGDEPTYNTGIESSLSVAQKQPRYAKIRDSAAARGIRNAYLFAGIANDETGLAMCYAEASFACPGPASPDCGGGAIIAGGADGPCSAHQGGLGMFQFDAGTYQDTINHYGAGVLTVDGQVASAIDYVVHMVKISAYTTHAETDDLARQWLNNFDPDNAALRDQWIKTVVRYYNGCQPGHACWNSRYQTYSAGLTAAINEPGGLGFWGGAAPVSSTVNVSRAGDFDGDGKADIITFTQGPSADVFVSLSSGNGFLGAGKWHDFFSIDGEVPSVGDFNGDGKADIVTFTRGSRADVIVALSSGSSFGAPRLWHDFFGLDGEVQAVGDFNGDGKDDIATFTRGSRADVIVALSNGSSFGPPTLWNDFFCLDGEVPAVGDFNGDGKDDIIVFTRGGNGDVFVALSTGTGFAPSAKWAHFFAINDELPVVGDFDGDGKADIATFTRGNAGDVYVAPSTGAGFLGASKWHDFFSIGGELPGAGDFDGDGKADIVTFTRGAAGKVYVSKSTGIGFAPSAIWNPFFAINNEIPQPSTNVH